jgi:hypothetical protein
MSVQDGTQTGSLDLSRFDAESFSRHSESIDTQAMIGEETCASHELSQRPIPDRLRRRQRAQKLAEIVGERMKLETNRVGGERTI